MPGIRSRITLIFLALLLPLTACVSPWQSVAAPTATETPTPPPTSTSTPTSTPTPVPEELLDAAEQFLFNGDWEAALAEYERVLAGGGDPEVRGLAQLGIGDTLIRSGRFEEATESLTTFISGFPGHSRLADGYFLRALAQERQSRDDLAVQDYDQYLALRPGALDSYILEHIGDALRRLGRPLDAIPRYQLALAAGHLGGDTTLQIKIGRAFLEAGDPATALAQFNQLYLSSTQAEVRAAANLLAGLALEDMGDFAAAHARYLDSVANYPQVADSYHALVRLVEDGVPVDDFQRGMVDYFAGAYEPALIVFDRVIASAPSGTAFYYRGLTRQALGDTYGARSDLAQATGYPSETHWGDAWIEQAFIEWAYLDLYPEAIQTLLAFVAAAPAHPQAPEALIRAGRVAERMGDLPGAASIWSRLPAEYPGNPEAHQGAFQAGIVLYRLGEYDAARQAFQQAESAAGDAGQRAAARLWVGKTRQIQGDTDGAQADWTAAAAMDPTGYYSERAGELAAGRPPFTRGGVFNFEVDEPAEQAQAETWLRTTLAVSGPDPLDQLSPALAEDPRMIRGLEFWRLGLLEEAKAELDALREAVAGDPEASYRLMHTLLDLRMYSTAIFAARQILRLAGMDDAATMSAPVYFNRIRFGPYFGDLILPEAARYGLDGLLLLSVVRQESLFEGFATSSASAQGLMQVIPSTGEWIAGQLGWPPGYTEADLHRPLVSVRFGTYYLASQRDAFGGDLYAALAAYNAGPGNAQIWRDLAGGDPDLFLEVVRLQEPRLYLTRIHEIYSIYTRLYVVQ